MPKDINLDGSEISVIKSIGLGGADASGEDLLSRLPDLPYAELYDTLTGLIGVGYVESDHTVTTEVEVFKKIHFRVNSGYAREIKDALDPRPEQGKNRRVRRE